MVIVPEDFGRGSEGDVGDRGSPSEVDGRVEFGERGDVGKES